MRTCSLSGVVADFRSGDISGVAANASIEATGGRFTTWYTPPDLVLALVHLARFEKSTALQTGKWRCDVEVVKSSQVCQQTWCTGIAPEPRSAVPDQEGELITAYVVHVCRHPLPSVPVAKLQQVLWDGSTVQYVEFAKQEMSPIVRFLWRFHRALVVL